MNHIRSNSNMPRIVPQGDRVKEFVTN